jgi:beta-lactamase regulating signal transducer with metallopeptidase domain
VGFAVGPEDGASLDATVSNSKLWLMVQISSLARRLPFTITSLEYLVSEQQSANKSSVVTTNEAPATKVVPSVMLVEISIPPR